MTFHLFLNTPLFLSDIVFKFNPVLISIVFATILLFYLLIIDKRLEVYPVPLRLFFIRTSKILMRLNLLFFKVFSLKILLYSYYVLIFHETFLPVEINPCVNSLMYNFPKWSDII